MKVLGYAILLLAISFLLLEASADDHSKHGPDCGCGSPGTAEISVIKFYDANVNGKRDDGDLLIPGWQIQIEGQSTTFPLTPVQENVAPGFFTVTESSSNVGTWIQTTDDDASFKLEKGDKAKIEFGNVCIGPGGAKSLEFWLLDCGTVFDDKDLVLLRSLNLKQDCGRCKDFDPFSYGEFRIFLWESEVANTIETRLSGQLAVLALNVQHDFVDEDNYVYAPGVCGANKAGFITVEDLIDEANKALCNCNADPETLEAFFEAISNANLNKTFVQCSPCKFGFCSVL